MPDASRPVDPPAQPPALEWGRALVYLAAERTLLSWVRAALAVIVLGFAVDRFGLLLASKNSTGIFGLAWSSRIGIGLVATGILTLAAAAMRYLVFARRYARREIRLEPGIPLAIGLCLLLVVAGSALATYLWLAAPGSTVATTGR